MCVALFAVTAQPHAARAQTTIDRIDPSRIERDNLPKPAKEVSKPAAIESAAESGATLTAAGSIEVGAIVFSGLAALTPADFAETITPYIGRTVAQVELAELAGKVGDRARTLGYPFASAWIEPQRLATGILTIRVDEGVVDEIRISGGDDRAVRRALEPLLGKPARLAEVERQLLLAGDIDGVTIVRNRFEREGRRGILLVEIRQRPQRLRMVLDNDSTSPVGPEQLRIDVDLSALLATDDAMSVTYVTTPFQPDELQYTRARYAKRLNASGTELQIAGSVSVARPGAYIKSLDLRGQSWTASIGLSHPLIRSRAQNLWLSGSLDVRDVEQRRAGTLFRHDRIAALRVAVNGNQKVAGGIIRASATLSQGFDIFNANSVGDALASRRDADGTFTTVSAWTDYTRALGSDFSVRLSAQAQAAFQPLLVSEEIGLGGSGFLRGYDYSERSGDQGAAASLELRYDWRGALGILRKAQLYGFADAGRVRNLASGFGGGKLASAGGGMRADVSSSVDANFEIAFPLSGPRYETGDRDPRVNLRLLKVF